MADFPCPCCGYLVFDDGPGSDDVCEICGWEDDLSQLRFASMGGGANEESLLSCQRQFAAAGQPKPKRQRDPQWRPLELGRDQLEVPEAGRDYGDSYARDKTAYYYWRR